MKGNISKIDNKLKNLNFKDLNEVKKFCLECKINVEKIIKNIQPIAFDNAISAYEVGVAMAIKNNNSDAGVCAEKIGEALQIFCKAGSVAEQRKVGIGHGNLAAKLLNEKTKCFCFLAGHESFAASEGAIGIVKSANKVRKTPLRVILNGLGKDAAYIIARIKGFIFVETSFNQKNHKLTILNEINFGNEQSVKNSKSNTKKMNNYSLKKEETNLNMDENNVRIYGAYDVNEGVEIMIHENVDVSITGNSTNIVRFTHPVAGEYKKYCIENGKNYFSVASGGGTGRTMHPDNVKAGPASYGLTDTMGRMHCDVQFAGSSSVPAHVSMMGFIGMGNNNIVGATVALAVECSRYLSEK
ncbi:MAG: GGGtGRT protein [Clostridia bacterium]|nr:GGGtGRT protein [Clostridia bacterium]